MWSWLRPMTDRRASGTTRPFWAAVHAIENGGAT